ncbi:hypothetical protein [Paraburkholderia kururiensis]|uniref:hypothetical protein n=1 Tax=Paraburkholderia kururiensis TaxID=984307 RepID=UPI0018F61871|nr:hypothetical protein [Paraburkholderia kururiensis]
MSSTVRRVVLLLPFSAFRSVFRQKPLVDAVKVLNSCDCGRARERSATVAGKVQFREKCRVRAERFCGRRRAAACRHGARVARSANGKTMPHEAGPGGRGRVRIVAKLHSSKVLVSHQGGSMPLSGAMRKQTLDGAAGLVR